MSENKIEYIIVCLDGVTSYDYEYSSDSFYGTISQTIEKWETCTSKEYEMICRYAKDKSTYEKKYLVVRRVDPVAEVKPNFTVEFIKEYYRKMKLQMRQKDRQQQKKDIKQKLTS